MASAIIRSHDWQGKSLEGMRYAGYPNANRLVHCFVNGSTQQYVTSPAMSKCTANGVCLFCVADYPTPQGTIALMIHSVERVERR